MSTVDAAVRAASAALVAALTARSRTVATAESLTGGWSAPPSRRARRLAVVRGAVVAYRARSRRRCSASTPACWRRSGAVDAGVAEQMAAGVREVMASDYGLATTGVAGPDPAGGKPVGRVFVAVAGPGTARVQELGLDGDREAVAQPDGARRPATAGRRWRPGRGGRS